MSNNEYPLGFIHQRDHYSCGAYAFSFILTILGVPNSISESKKNCKTISLFESAKNSLMRIEFVFQPTGIFDEAGTEFYNIMSAIKKVGLKPTVYKIDSEKKAKQVIENSLKNYSPLILSVNYDMKPEDLGHYLTVGGKHKDKYVIFDSSPLKGEVIKLMSWKELRRRLIWIDEDYKKYFLMESVSAKSNYGMVKNLPSVIKQLLSDSYLREWWGYFLDDLLEIFDNSKSISASKLISKYQKLIIDQAKFWIYDLDKSDAVYLLDCYKNIFDAYNMKYNKTETEEILIKLTTLFTSSLILEN